MKKKPGWLFLNLSQSIRPRGSNKWHNQRRNSLIKHEEKLTLNASNGFLETDVRKYVRSIEWNVPLEQWSLSQEVEEEEENDDDDHHNHHHYTKRRHRDQLEFFITGGHSILSL